MFRSTDLTCARCTPGVTVFETSARAGQGVAEWCAWLSTQHSTGVGERSGQ